MLLKSHPQMMRVAGNFHKAVKCHRLVFANELLKLKARRDLSDFLRRFKSLFLCISLTQSRCTRLRDMH